MIYTKYIVLPFLGLLVGLFGLLVMPFAFLFLAAWNLRQNLKHNWISR